MKIKHQLTLSLGAPNQAMLAVKQGDIDSRLVECTLLNGGVEETIPEGASARVAFHKPDGKQVLNDAEIVDNHVVFLLTQQMLAVIGEASCEIIMSKDSALLSSAVFPVEIQPMACDGSEIESSPEYQTFANTLLEADGAIAQATGAAAAANSAAQEAEEALGALNFSQLSSGTLPQWDGEKLANGVAVSSVVSPNLLVNPGFSINQRGGSSYSTANEYTVDRWMLESGSVSTTSGNNGLSLSNASVCQFIEGMEQLSGTVLTLSVFLGGALKKVSGVLSASAVSENGLSFVWTSTGYIKVGITGSGSLEWAKLELGSTATPYSPPDPAAELLKCQRYYYRIVQGSGTAFHVAVGGAQGQGANIYFPVLLPVSMRATPQLSYSGVQAWNGASNSYVLNTIIIQASDSTNRLLTVTAQGSGATGGALYTLLVNSSNSAYLAFDAEITA